MKRAGGMLFCWIITAVLLLTGCSGRENGDGSEPERLGIDGEELEHRPEESEKKENELQQELGNTDDKEKGTEGNNAADETKTDDGQAVGETEEKKEYIKWVDFQVTYEALDAAYKYDIESYGTEVHFQWIELLAYLGSKYGGDFKRFRTEDMKKLCERLLNGETMEELTKEMGYYSYYKEAYEAVLGGMVGEYQIEVQEEENIDEKKGMYETRYGLKAFSPIAKNFPYSDYDDFGASRSYGYRRVHLGHDMMGATGTPIIAVESGYVEALGWNQYGGWRIGIRSFDGKRYYYYAHLRKDFPYNKELKEGSIVQAGDVIGYLGHTGYSVKENVNNIDVPHLHFGIQLIFDESQKEGNNEIWIDCYALVRFLYRNRSETVKVPETKEWVRVHQFIDPAAEEYKKQSNASKDTMTE